MDVIFTILRDGNTNKSKSLLYSQISLLVEIKPCFIEYLQMSPYRAMQTKFEELKKGKPFRGS